MSTLSRFGQLLLALGLAVALSVGASAGWTQPSSSNSAPPVEPMEASKPPPKLQIGAVAGLPRPEGFVVEDLRTAEMKAASAFKQTYKAPMAMPFQRQPVPLAKYERMVGEEELSAPPGALSKAALRETVAKSVEVNLQIVPRARHAEHVLADGDRLEIVSLVGGG